MASSKRERSMGYNTSHEEAPDLKRSRNTDIMNRFTVQVKLRSQSKAARNDHKPVKTWRQHCVDWGRLRREAEAKGEAPPEVLPTEDYNRVRNAQPAKKRQSVPANEDTDSQDDSDGSAVDFEQDSDDDEFAEFKWLEQMDATVEMVDPANPKKTSRRPRAAHAGDQYVGIIERLRYKYGCTCRKCLGGFFSPRMRFALRNKAESTYDTLDMLMGMDMEFLFNDLDDMCHPCLQYVPLSVRNNMKTNKSMRQGFANLFSRFAALTRNDSSGGLPTEANMRLHLETESEWPPHCKNFLTRGGSIYAIGSYIFESALNEDDVAGDGDPMLLPLDEDEKEELRDSNFEAEHANLPKCRNDLEYGFVSAMLGYKRVSREYYHMG